MREPQSPLRETFAGTLFVGVLKVHCAENKAHFPIDSATFSAIFEVRFGFSVSVHRRF